MTRKKWREGVKGNEKKEKGMKRNNIFAFYAAGPVTTQRCRLFNDICFIDLSNILVVL